MYRCGPACHDAIVRPYVAYLRVYEPLSAFGEAEGGRWADYAASTQRPRRSAALDAEQAEALGRVIACPPVAAPEQESGHAYVRWADGVTYICPWQTRLRSWLALTRLRSTARPLVTTAFAGGPGRHGVARLRPVAGPGLLAAGVHPGLHVVGAGRLVRAVRPEERWLVLGGADPGAGGPAELARATRTLSYATAMPQARRRIARALNAVCGGGDALVVRRAGWWRAAEAPASRRAPRPPIRGRTGSARGPRIPGCSASGPAPRSHRSAGGLRSSIRIRSWNWTTAGSCTCSMMTRCGLTSRSPRCRRPSALAGKASRNWRSRCISGCGPMAGTGVNSKPPTE